MTKIKKCLEVVHNRTFKILSKNYKVYCVTCNRRVGIFNAYCGPCRRVGTLRNWKKFRKTQYK